MKVPKDPKTQAPKETLKGKGPSVSAGIWPEAGDSGLMELREGSDGKVYDLEERTAQFGEAIIRFTKRIPKGAGNNRLIDQLIGCGTSVGANYCEADEAVSRKDFKVKIGYCRKELRETKFFLRMVAAAEEQLRKEARALWKEANELLLIFSTIYNK
jgi:four helix bundle protein